MSKIERITDEDIRRAVRILKSAEEQIVFEVEGRPLSWNKYYGGAHWRVRQANSEEWKWRVKASLIKYKIARLAFANPVEIRFEIYVGRPIDPDNIVLKTYIDGLRDWGVLINDDPRYVRKISVEVHTKQKREYALITIL